MRWSCAGFHWPDAACGARAPAPSSARALWVERPRGALRSCSSSTIRLCSGCAQHRNPGCNRHHHRPLRGVFGSRLHDNPDRSVADLGRALRRMHLGHQPRLRMGWAFDKPGTVHGIHSGPSWGLLVARECPATASSNRHGSRCDPNLLESETAVE
jgi:hypothetical protein